MTTRQYCVVSGALFCLVAAAHLARLVFALPVEVGAFTVPLQVSWIGVAVPGALAYQAFRLAGRARYV